jgi:hypothetical protein
MVPCCQAEVARTRNAGKALQPESHAPGRAVAPPAAHPRDGQSDHERAALPVPGGVSGYQVTVTELVGWEHSLKNELIIAKYTGQKKRSAAERLRAILEQFGIESLLETRFKLPDNPG